MSDVAGNSQGNRRRRKRQLTAEEKYEIYLALVAGEMSQNEAAERYGVDRSTVARIRVVGKDAVLEALANSRPGRRKDQVDPELKAARPRWNGSARSSRSRRSSWSRCEQNRAGASRRSRAGTGRR